MKEGLDSCYSIFVDICGLNAWFSYSRSIKEGLDSCYSFFEDIRDLWFECLVFLFQKYERRLGFLLLVFCRYKRFVV